MKRRRTTLALAGILFVGFAIGVLVGQHTQSWAVAADTKEPLQIAKPFLAPVQAIDAEALETYQFLNWTLEQLMLMENLLLQALAEYEAGTLTLSNLENYYYYAHLNLAAEITQRMPSMFSISFGVWDMFFSGIEEAWDDAAMFARCAGVNAGAGGAATYLNNGFSYLSVLRNSISSALTGGAP